MKNYVDIYDIKRNHRGHFFDPGSMRFFDSRTSQGGWRVGDKAYFLTSERFHGSSYSGARLYTVRVLDYKTGDVDTVGDFNKLTRSQANTALMKVVHEAEHMADFQRDEVTL